MVDKPTYIVFDDVLRDKSLKRYLDICIKEIQEEKAHMSRTRAKAGYHSWSCFRVEGKEILVAEEFTDKMRTLCGWHWDVDRVLKKWIDKVIINPFLYDASDSKYEHKWVLKPENPGYALSEEHLKFACFIAVCFTKYGHSYAIEFKGQSKVYLPIKKLPKKGVNRLFANAILYPKIHDKIERYAKLAMNEFEWYLNLDGEYCAMPGTFAVFALGLYDEKITSLYAII